MHLTANQWRKVSRVLAIASLLSFCLCLAGCAGLPVWITDAQQILPVAVSIITSILSAVAALQGKTIDANVAATITAVANEAQTGLADLESLVKQYEANASAGLLADIENAANVVVNNLKTIMNDAQITDAATQQKITAIAGLVVGQLEAWISTLPLLKAAAGDKVTITVPLTAHAFKLSFDEIIRMPTGSAEVDEVFAKVKTL